MMMQKDSPLKNSPLKDKYGFIILLLSLVCLLILPSYWQGQHRQVVTAFLLIIMMLSFLSLVAKKKFEMLLGSLLALPVLYLNLYNALASDPKPETLLYLLNILFYLFIIVELFRHFNRQKTADFNIIAAAIIVYFIIGLLWSYIYIILEIENPGSILSEATSGEPLFYSLLYFSYVTLTTLGYGDISPQTELAGKWVVLEAVIGQFYIAVLVAKLVSLYNAGPSEP